MKAKLIILLAALLLAAAPASAQLTKLRFVNYKLVKMVPVSLEKVKGTFAFDVVNDTTAFTMSNISGTVYKNGKQLVSGMTPNINVPKGKSSFTIEGLANLSGNTNIMQVMQCIFFKPEEYTIDVSLTVTDSKGKRKEIVELGMSVADLLNNR